MLQREIEITGAGRTDTGVHAREMYAHLDLEEMPRDPGRFLSSLNKMVGRDIAVEAILPVVDDAHARFDALSRTYKYYISPYKSPFDYDFCCRVEHHLDVEAMIQASRLLTDTEDFTSFAKLHTDTKTNICKVSEARWNVDADGRLEFTVTADRFLRNMVRSLVGTLMMVGSGKIGTKEFKEIIDAKDRCAAGTSAPAQGLFLEKIVYPSNIFL